VAPAGGSIDDAELARRAVAGDRDAFVDIVRRHQAAAIRLASALGPVDDAEDAAQEAFMKAHRALARYDRSRPLRPWLLAIVANEARSRGRRARRATSLIERVAEREPPPSRVSSPEELALARVGSGRLMEAFAGLNRHERETLALRYVLDHSEEETAVILGCARGTVKSRAARGLARLRDQLGEVPS